MNEIKTNGSSMQYEFSGSSGHRALTVSFVADVLSRSSRKRGTTTIAAMTMRSPKARSFTHQTASSAMAPMEPARWARRWSAGKDVVYKQVLTDPGMFSIIYGGASGAMQSFHRRGMKQDEMLKIVAYVRTLDK